MAAPEAEALIVVDLQRAFVEGAGAVPGADVLVASVQRLVARAREAGAAVFHLQNDGRVGAVDEPQSPGWTLALGTGADEHIIRKSGDDGFAGTNLGTLLREHGVGTVVVCGVQSEMCIAATARAAMSRGLTVVLPRDSHGTYPIPADGEHSVAVPAAHVARVAQWSLGDELVAVDRHDDVTFCAAVRP